LRSVLASKNTVLPIVQPSESELMLVANALAAASSETPKITTTELTASSPGLGDQPMDIPAPSATKPEQAVPPTATLRRSTRCIPLRELALDDVERRKVDRYLDVTKSALLFGGRVLLVEGIAEALLLPILAKNYVLKGDQEKFRIFRSAVFVPIDGVDFECYLRLLLTPYNDIRIADHVVVITDGDRTDHGPGELTPGELRKASYDKLANELNASQNFHAVDQRGKWCVDEAGLPEAPPQIGTEMGRSEREGGR